MLCFIMLILWMGLLIHWPPFNGLKLMFKKINLSSTLTEPPTLKKASSQIQSRVLWGREKEQGTCPQGDYSLTSSVIADRIIQRKSTQPECCKRGINKISCESKKWTTYLDWLRGSRELFINKKGVWAGLRDRLDFHSRKYDGEPSKTSEAQYDPKEERVYALFRVLLDCGLKSKATWENIGKRGSTCHQRSDKEDFECPA